MATLDTHTAQALEQAPAEATQTYGIIAEYDNVGEVMRAAKAARDAGYTRLDVHSPFPIHGIDQVLGIRPTILPWIVLVMGILGCFTGYILTMYTMSGFSTGASADFWDFLWVNLEPYRYLISGKPMQSLPAFIPVMFELTIMFAAYTGVFAMFLLNKLPRLHHPLFTSDRFRRATQDRFFLAIEAEDRNFDENQTAQWLSEHGALATEVVRS